MSKLTNNQQAAQKRIAQKRKIQQKKEFRRALIFKKFSEPSTQPRPASPAVVDDSDEASECIAAVREYRQYLDHIKWRKFSPITVTQA
jgi:hypothetical protein